MPPVVIDLRQAEDWRDVVHQAVQALVEGKLVAFPTETVYGLAASALDERAVGAAGRGQGPQAGPRPVPGREERRRGPGLRARHERPGPAAGAAVLARPDHAGRGRLAPGEPGAAAAARGAAVRIAGPDGGAARARPPGAAGRAADAGRAAGLDQRQSRAGPEAVTAREVLDALGDAVDLVLDDGPCRFGEPSSVVRVTGNRYEILRAGVVPEKTLQRLASLMILFVCTGNTCRSPMAEAICRHLLARRMGCKVAGIGGPRRAGDVGRALRPCWAAGPAPRPSRSWPAMGLDISDHETQPLTEPWCGTPT